MGETRRLTRRDDRGVGDAMILFQNELRKFHLFQKGKKGLGLVAMVLALTLFLAACGNGTTTASQADKVFPGQRAQSTIRIVSGSENRVLEPIIEEFTKKNPVTIEMTYMGSLEIMRLLQGDQIPYDAVWPASSLWVSVGDEAHRVKHLESTSTTPVIFGIKESVAERLGFIGRDVYVRDLLTAIQNKELTFTMTSATQSNSGASAYIGFIYALLGSPEQITLEALHDQNFQEEMRNLLAGVERSSGSSDWLKDLYLQGDYDAMVNYEALIISANQELERENREVMHAIYPVDGMMMANSPLGFVSSNGESGRDEQKQEEAFLRFQEYLLSAEVQDQIQRTGRRTGVGNVDPKNSDVFRTDWGIDTGRVISTINMPKQDVLFEALNLYQSSFKKPGLNVYVLDFSGSMQGQGREQLVQALGEIMISENAAKNFLQASDTEKNVFIPFNSQSYTPEAVVGGGAALEALYQDLSKIPASGGTALYEAVLDALTYIQGEDLNYYSPSIIIMSDGQPNGAMGFRDLETRYQEMKLDIPIFSILFGSADESQMDQIAELSRARVFDGREDLTAAFRSVRGYN